MNVKDTIKDLVERIRERAHAIWEREGRPEGRHEEHWYQATREVEAEARPAKPARARKAAAEPPAAKPTRRKTEAAGPAQPARSRRKAATQPADAAAAVVAPSAPAGAQEPAKGRRGRGKTWTPEDIASAPPATKGGRRKAAGTEETQGAQPETGKAKRTRGRNPSDTPTMH